MTAGASDTAFRAQLVLTEQKQLFDYWCTKQASDQLPNRNQICPTEISGLLSNVSLIDIERDPFRFKFRLAGTRLREVYDREVTGLELSECGPDFNQDYWTRTYVHVSETGKPAQGVIRGPCADKEHLVHFWLRLPLATLDNCPAMLLCHDAIVPAEQMPGVSDIEVIAGQRAIAV